MKKILNKIIIAVMSAMMAFSVPAVAMADDAHFTFTNFNEDQPDLYVYKSVSSALDGYTVPDTEFTFVLKWDKDGDGYLEFADNVSYFVYNADGSQVMNENTSDGSFRTSSTGRFTLKDGQYARFEWAGQVEYEITELESSNFTQTEPVGGTSASGTVPAEGTIVTFENLYVPSSSGGGGGEEPEYTQVAIRKDIAWADGYEVPSDIDTEFEFTIKIDGEIYKNQPYTIYNSTMTNSLGSGTTESDGSFTMSGGQTVVFDEVETGVDYEITESGDTGWQAVGNTFYGGSTTSPIVYTYFANETTNLVVEKERLDGATGLDDEFIFILTDGSDVPLADVSYYIYDTDGNLISEEFKTDEKGQFVLKAGEQALFVGVAEGTGYKVSEDLAQTSGYEIDSDKSYEGTIGFGSTDTDVFVNEQLTDIAITKYGKIINSDRNLLAGAEFTLNVLNESGEWEKFGDSLTTGDNGVVSFKGLPSGTYQIVETKVPEGYVRLDDPIEITLPLTSEEEVEGAVYSERDGIYYVYYLEYEVDNMAQLVTMPNTGGWTWLIWVCVAVGGTAVIAGAFIYRANKQKALKAKEER